MSKFILNPKTYKGRELEEIFFRPILTGPDAAALGVSIKLNMPVPTTYNYWKRTGAVLKEYKRGFQGGTLADKYQKTINLEKCKAEMCANPEDYFAMIYELITNQWNINLQDLTATKLLEAEVYLFREALKEDIRLTMWAGAKASHTAGKADHNAFDGFLPRINADLGTDINSIKELTFPVAMNADPDAARTLFEALWETANPMLRNTKAEGNLAIFVTDDVYDNYEKSLEGTYLESAFTALQQGRDVLRWRGIPIDRIGISSQIDANEIKVPHKHFAILTDRRNLCFALNTTNFGDSDVQMWYNRDEIENRVRSIFMAGCDYLLPELMVYSHE